VDEQDEAPLDLASARAAIDELFTLAKKYNASASYLELMRFIGRFRFYSPFNAMLIYTQMPGAHSSALPAGGGRTIIETSKSTRGRL
jgi:hypothetical protein